MVREDLVRYVQQYSAQGYDISTLRDSLLQQGYAAQDVEEALLTVSGKKFPLIKAGFILGGVIIVLVVVLLIFGLTGEKVEVERPAYIPPEAPIAPLEEIEEEVGEEIEEAPEIVEEIPEIPSAPLTCPAQCNDYSICTRDLCLEGQCVFEEITPCCGNFQCEFGETEESCPDDCARERLTQEESTEVILTEAEKVAKRNKKKAVQLCQSLVRTSAMDNCLKNVASIAQDIGVCGAVFSIKKKDECYMNHAIDQEDFSACPNIENRWLRNSCIQYGRLRTAQIPSNP